MHPTDQRSILVVGAGPTGLVLAYNLARRGVIARIIDKKSGPSKESRAIVIHARTMEFYRQLGLMDDILAHSSKVDVARFRDGERDLARLSLLHMGEGQSPYPFSLCYPQNQHERMLIRELGKLGVTIEWGVELKSLSQDRDVVRLVLTKAGGEETSQASYVCGCDGGGSAVRHALGIGFGGGTDDELFYVADVTLAGDKNTDILINLAWNGLALLFPMPDSERIVGVIPHAMRAQTGLTFEDVRPIVHQLLGVRVTGVNWFSTYHVHHRVADRFTSGRCFLAGDAGHIHSPTGGQGMNTGIGDATNLAWKLAHVVQGRADATILDSYEAERIPFARRLVATTDAVFHRLIGVGWSARFLRSWIAPRVVAVVSNFRWLHRALFRTISQVRISYRHSPLSQGKAATLSGGDRLPWVADGGDDNFAPLRSLDWQLHVYGALEPGLAQTAQRLGLAVHTFAWTEPAKNAGLQRDAAYLVRPDGHLALVMAHQDATQLTAYGNRHGLMFDARPELEAAASRTAPTQD